jgi:hypothetical protein
MMAERLSVGAINVAADAVTAGDKQADGKQSITRDVKGQKRSAIDDRFYARVLERHGRAISMR